MEIDKVYEPQRFEPHWAQRWIDSAIFKADPRAPGPVFSIVIPPPNVTGSLHIGHMLEHTIIDVTTRWHRMQGFNTLWLPGTDHAGISTQIMVERKLAEEGLKRRDLGREAFEARVWEWREQYGGRILEQMRRVGSSVDWSRLKFTLDPDLSRAVREAFVRLYEKGLIYRGEYMVNWCPRCNTALSDLEVIHDDQQGNLWHIRYPVKGTDRFLTVATTRPETMLGDSALAINAKDARYLDLHGKTVTVPLVDREVPIVLDEIADPKFGTGVVKVTPAHDPNDFEAGKRHNLPRIKVINEAGRMTAEAGEYAGLDRFEARKLVLAALATADRLEKTEPYAVSLSKCERCKTIVEPLLSTQWFVRMKPLAAPAIKAVEENRIVLHPPNWKKTYFEWMNNIRDWCISRQLWWGHRIPAWHCAHCNHITVGRRDPTKCEECGSSDIHQDEDVLDTWFSSSLWPCSTLGWPDDTEDLGKYYPTTLLVTGFDILFFWVSRMIVMGIEFMGDVPFREVHMHGLVRDADRQKMSKTKGNVIDPLLINEKYGTDAVRLALLMSAASGADIAFGEERMISARSFANKVWNASRLLFLNMERAGVEPQIPAPGKPESLEDRWIFSRLDACAGIVNRAVEQHRYHEVAETLWHFFWGEFCDWYLEIKKLSVSDNSGLDNSWRNLLTAFERSLRLLHPVMPFLTEELWQRLANGDSRHAKSIALAPYPAHGEFADSGADAEMAVLQELITAVRTLRADRRVEKKLVLEGVLYARDLSFTVATTQQAVIESLGNVRLAIHNRQAPKMDGAVRSTPEFDLVLDIPVAAEESGEDLQAQRMRLQKECEQLEKLIDNSNRQLTDENFLAKAPPKIIETIRTKLADYETQLAKSRAALGS